MYRFARRQHETLRHLSLFVLIASGAGQIEHAPTVAQCQADQRLWYSQIQHGDSSLKYEVLRDRVDEMITCNDVDPPHTTDYYNTASLNMAAIATRMGHFIQRHQLWDKFLEEDAAGKR